MEFRILGPLEVVDDGRPISIRRGKEEAVLAYLLLHANEVVPSERLIDELWGERPPPTAPKILQNAVSHLRKELGGGRLLTSGHGYVLRVGDDELDLQKFERLAREGRNEEALALWRGTALVNLRDEHFAEDARRRLEEQRLAVVEDRIDSDLSAGRDSELVPELEELVAAQPLRERLQGQLMTALYRAGRQADALEAYQRARRTLSTELGLEPGPRLQELERRILNQDPALAPSRARRSARPSLPRARRRGGLLVLAGASLVAAAVLGLVFAFAGNNSPLVAPRNSVAIVDPSRNQVVNVIPVGHTPRGIAVSNDSAWVTNSADGTVSQIDTKELKVVKTIGIAAQATDVALAAGGVWVVTGIDNGLVHIDEQSGGVLGRLRLSRDPSASAYTVVAQKDAVWAGSGDRLLRVDPRTSTIVSGRRSLSCCHAINDVAVGTGAIWIADLGEQVVRLSAAGNRVTGGESLGVTPTAVAVGYGAVWLGVPDPIHPAVALWRVDPQTVRVTQTIQVGKSTQFLPTVEMALGARAIWITNYDSGTLVRIDPFSGKVLAKIRIGKHPFGVAFGAGRVWVTVS